MVSSEVAFVLLQSLFLIRAKLITNRNSFLITSVDRATFWGIVLSVKKADEKEEREACETICFCGAHYRAKQKPKEVLMEY